MEYESKCNQSQMSFKEYSNSCVFATSFTVLNNIHQLLIKTFRLIIFHQLLDIHCSCQAYKNHMRESYVRSLIKSQILEARLAL